MSMPTLRRTWWIAALVLGFGVGAAIDAPLHVVAGGFGHGDDLRRNRVVGTLWHWRAVTPEGVRLEFVAAPLQLLRLRYAGRLVAELDGMRLEGDAARALDGTLELRSARIEATLAPLAQALGMPPSMLQGRLALAPVGLAWRTGSVSEFDCSGGVEGLRAGDGVTDLDLGALTVGCRLTDAGPLITVDDRGGVLAFHATIALAADGRFLLAGTAGARPGAPPELAMALPLLGRQSGPDEVSFRYAGALPGSSR